MSTTIVFSEDREYFSRGKEIAQLLGLEFFTEKPKVHFDFSLKVGDVVSLEPTEGSGPLVIDYASGAVDYRRRFGKAGGDPLVKAIGGGERKVLDTTAGLGRDAFAMASCGCHVTALEKNPIVGELVKDALKRANESLKTNKVSKNIDFQIKNSKEYLKTLTPEIFDTVYIDPMFPPKKKSALPKKEMVILQKLLGHDDETEIRELLNLARTKSNRVVLKRPAKGDEVEDGVSLKFEGSAIRYDVYVQRC